MDDQCQQDNAEALCGVVAFVPRRVDGDMSVQTAVCTKLTTLGARVVPRFARDVTHIVFCKKLLPSHHEHAVQEDILRDIYERLEKANSTAFVVSSLWVQACAELGQRADEDEYLVLKPGEPKQAKFYAISPPKGAIARPRAARRKSVAVPLQHDALADMFDADALMCSSSQQIRELATGDAMSKRLPGAVIDAQLAPSSSARKRKAASAACAPARSKVATLMPPPPRNSAGKAAKSGATATTPKHEAAADHSPASGTAAAKQASGAKTSGASSKSGDKSSKALMPPPPAPSAAAPAAAPAAAKGSSVTARAQAASAAKASAKQGGGVALQTPPTAPAQQQQQRKKSVAWATNLTPSLSPLSLLASASKQDPGGAGDSSRPAFGSPAAATSEAAAPVAGKSAITPAAASSRRLRTPGSAVAVTPLASLPAAKTPLSVATGLSLGDGATGLTTEDVVDLISSGSGLGSGDDIGAAGSYFGGPSPWGGFSVPPATGTASEVRAAGVGTGAKNKTAKAALFQSTPDPTATGKPAAAGKENQPLRCMQDEPARTGGGSAPATCFKPAAAAEAQADGGDVPAADAAAADARKVASAPGSAVGSHRKQQRSASRAGMLLAQRAAAAAAAAAADTAGTPTLVGSQPASTPKFAFDGMGRSGAVGGIKLTPGSVLVPKLKTPKDGTLGGAAEVGAEDEQLAQEGTAAAAAEAPTADEHASAAQSGEAVGIALPPAANAMQPSRGRWSSVIPSSIPASLANSPLSLCNTAAKADGASRDSLFRLQPVREENQVQAVAAFSFQALGTPAADLQVHTAAEHGNGGATPTLLPATTKRTRKQAQAQQPKVEPAGEEEQVECNNKQPRRTPGKAATRSSNTPRQADPTEAAVAAAAAPAAEQAQQKEQQEPGSVAPTPSRRSTRLQRQSAAAPVAAPAEEAAKRALFKEETNGTTQPAREAVVAVAGSMPTGTPARIRARAAAAAGGSDLPATPVSTRPRRGAAAVAAATTPTAAVAEDSVLLATPPGSKPAPDAAAAAPSGALPATPAGSASVVTSQLPAGTPVTTPSHFTRLQRRRFRKETGLDLEQLPKAQAFTVQSDGSLISSQQQTCSEATSAAPGSVAGGSAVAAARKRRRTAAVATAPLEAVQELPGTGDPSCVNSPAAAAAAAAAAATLLPQGVQQLLQQEQQQGKGSGPTSPTAEHRSNDHVDVLEPEAADAAGADCMHIDSSQEGSGDSMDGPASLQPHHHQSQAHPCSGAAPAARNGKDVNEARSARRSARQLRGSETGHSTPCAALQRAVGGSSAAGMDAAAEPPSQMKPVAATPATATTATRGRGGRVVASRYLSSVPASVNRPTAANAAAGAAASTPAAAPAQQQRQPGSAATGRIQPRHLSAVTQAEVRRSSVSGGPGACAAAQPTDLGGCAGGRKRVRGAEVQPASSPTASDNRCSAGSQPGVPSAKRQRREPSAALTNKQLQRQQLATVPEAQPIGADPQLPEQQQKAPVRVSKLSRSAYQQQQQQQQQQQKLVSNKAAAADGTGTSAGTGAAKAPSQQQARQPLVGRAAVPQASEPSISKISITASAATASTGVVVLARGKAAALKAGAVDKQGMKQCDMRSFLKPAPSGQAASTATHDQAPSVGAAPSMQQQQQGGGIKGSPALYLAYTSVDAGVVANIQTAVRTIGGAKLCVEGYEDGRITHLVVGAERRTLKMLIAIANGAHVVSPEWVAASLQAGAWQGEDQYKATVRFTATADRVRALRQQELLQLQQQQGHPGSSSPNAAYFHATAATAGAPAPAVAAAATGPSSSRPLPGRQVCVHCQPGAAGSAAASKAAEHRQGLQKLVVALGGRVVPVRTAELCVIAGASVQRPRGMVKGTPAVSEEWLLKLAETHEFPDMRPFEVK